MRELVLHESGRDSIICWYVTRPSDAATRSRSADPRTHDQQGRLGWAAVCTDRLQRDPSPGDDDGDQGRQRDQWASCYLRYCQNSGRQRERQEARTAAAPATFIPLRQLISDINMMVQTGGKERTNNEHAELFARVGLRLIPGLADQNPCAQSRSPMDMMVQG